MLKHAWFSFPMHNLVFIVSPLSEPGIASWATNFLKPRHTIVLLFMQHVKDLPYLEKESWFTITVSDGASRGRNENGSNQCFSAIWLRKVSQWFLNHSHSTLISSDLVSFLESPSYQLHPWFSTILHSCNFTVVSSEYPGGPQGVHKVPPVRNAAIEDGLRSHRTGKVPFVLSPDPLSDLFLAPFPSSTQ